MIPSDIDKISRVRDAFKGKMLRFEDFDSASRSHMVRIGEHVLLKNKEGFFMQIKIMSVKSEGYGGDTRDEVVFEYQINQEKSSTFSAL